MIGLGDPGIRCSSAGCTADAAFRVNWRNPRIHGPERVKVWLACAAHRDSLSGYLSSRGFPVQVTPLAVELDRIPDPA
ncbi:hypothetical protein [Protaetiibacter larvae]|uniref:Acetone carboxylase n=1 Tax=Protaetiibacter larvae TaxID=2592654 RepID=A0A5C1YA46_9MICO|nr:hypothetical protein [Protaetiibacter larvae]QEO10059.1 hypothetical protein FLP23_08610 [Protaetiibacter larvae]